MIESWKLNPADFDVLKRAIPEAPIWADTIRTETVELGSGYDVPPGYVLLTDGDKPRLIYDVINDHSVRRLHERAVMLLRSIDALP